MLFKTCEPDDGLAGAAPSLSQVAMAACSHAGRPPLRYNKSNVVGHRLQRSLPGGKKEGPRAEAAHGVVNAAATATAEASTW